MTYQIVDLNFALAISNSMNIGSEDPVILKQCSQSPQLLVDKRRKCDGREDPGEWIGLIGKLAMNLRPSWLEFLCQLLRQDRIDDVGLAT